MPGECAQPGQGLESPVWELQEKARFCVDGQREDAETGERSGGQALTVSGLQGRAWRRRSGRWKRGDGWVEESGISFRGSTIDPGDDELDLFLGK
jgi:hypothetical protein